MSEFDTQGARKSSLGEFAAEILGADESALRRSSRHRRLQRRGKPAPAAVLGAILNKAHKGNVPARKAAAKIAVKTSLVSKALANKIASIVKGSFVGAEQANAALRSAKKAHVVSTALATKLKAGQALTANEFNHLRGAVQTCGQLRKLSDAIAASKARPADTSGEFTQEIMGADDAAAATAKKVALWSKLTELNTLSPNQVPAFMKKNQLPPLTIAQKVRLQQLTKTANSIIQKQVAAGKYTGKLPASVLGTASFGQAVKLAPKTWVNMTAVAVAKPQKLPVFLKRNKISLTSGQQSQLKKLTALTAHTIRRQALTGKVSPPTTSGDWSDIWGAVKAVHNVAMAPVRLAAQGVQWVAQKTGILPGQQSGPAQPAGPPSPDAQVAAYGQQMAAAAQARQARVQAARMRSLAARQRAAAADSESRQAQAEMMAQAQAAAAEADAQDAEAAAMDAKMAAQSAQYETAEAMSMAEGDSSGWWSAAVPLGNKNEYLETRQTPGQTPATFAGSWYDNPDITFEIEKEAALPPLRLLRSSIEKNGHKSVPTGKIKEAIATSQKYRLDDLLAFFQKTAKDLGVDKTGWWSKAVPLGNKNEYLQTPQTPGQTPATFAGADEFGWWSAAVPLGNKNEYLETSQTPGQTPATFAGEDPAPWSPQGQLNQLQRDAGSSLVSSLFNKKASPSTGQPLPSRPIDPQVQQRINQQTLQMLLDSLPDGTGAKKLASYLKDAGVSVTPVQFSQILKDKNISATSGAFVGNGAKRESYDDVKARIDAQLDALPPSSPESEALARQAIVAKGFIDWKNQIQTGKVVIDKISARKAQVVGTKYRIPGEVITFFQKLADAADSSGAFVGKDADPAELLAMKKNVLAVATKIKNGDKDLSVEDAKTALEQAKKIGLSKKMVAFIEKAATGSKDLVFGMGSHTFLGVEDFQGPWTLDVKPLHGKQIIGAAASSTKTGQKIRAGASVVRAAKAGNPKAKVAIAKVNQKAKAGDPQAKKDLNSIKAGKLALDHKQKALSLAAIKAKLAAQAKRNIAARAKMEAAAAAALSRAERKHKLAKVAKVERLAAAGHKPSVAVVKKNVAAAKAGDKKAKTNVEALKLAKRVRVQSKTPQLRADLKEASKVYAKAKAGNKQAIQKILVVQSAAKAGQPNAKRAQARLQTAKDVDIAVKTGKLGPAAKIAAGAAAGAAVTAAAFAAAKKRSDEKKKAQKTAALRTLEKKYAAHTVDVLIQSGLVKASDRADATKMAERFHGLKAAPAQIAALTNAGFIQKSEQKQAVAVATKAQAGKAAAAQAVVNKIEAAPTIITTTSAAPVVTAELQKKVEQTQQRVASGVATREEAVAGAAAAKTLSQDPALPPEARQEAAAQSGQLALQSAQLRSGTDELRRTAGVAAAVQAGNPTANAMLNNTLKTAETGNPTGINEAGKLAAVRTIDELNQGKPMTQPMAQAMDLVQRGQAGDAEATETIKKVGEAAQAGNQRGVEGAIALTGAAALLGATAAKPAAKAEIEDAASKALGRHIAPEQAASASGELDQLVAKVKKGDASEAEATRAKNLAMGLKRPGTVAEISAIMPPRSVSNPLSNDGASGLAPITGLGSLIKESLKALLFVTPDPLQNYREGVLSRSADLMFVAGEELSGMGSWWNPLTWGQDGIGDDSTAMLSTAWNNATPVGPTIDASSFVDTRYTLPPGSSSYNPASQGPPAYNPPGYSTTTYPAPAPSYPTSYPSSYPPAGGYDNGVQKARLRDLVSKLNNRTITQAEAQEAVSLASSIGKPQWAAKIQRHAQRLFNPQAAGQGQGQGRRHHRRRRQTW